MIIKKIKKTMGFIVLVFMLISSVFGVSLSDISTDEVYEPTVWGSVKSFFNGFTLSSVDSDSYPYRVGSSPTMISVSDKTLTTWSIADKYNYIQKLNPVNDNDATSWDASFVKIYEIERGTGRGIFIDSKTIGIKETIKLKEGKMYLFEFYNYDVCAYWDNHANYVPQDWSYSNDCSSKAGSSHSAEYDRIIKEQEEKAEQTAKWIAETYDASDSVKFIEEYKSLLAVLKKRYNSCEDTWYMPQAYCNAIYTDYENCRNTINDLTDDYNDAGRLNKVNAKKHLDIISKEIIQHQDKTEYYRKKEKHENPDLYKKKTDDDSYEEQDETIKLVNDRIDTTTTYITNIYEASEISKLPTTKVDGDGKITDHPASTFSYSYLEIILFVGLCIAGIVYYKKNKKKIRGYFK